MFSVSRHTAPLAFEFQESMLSRLTPILAVLLLPLAITSNKAMVRRLGRKWKALHQLVYAILLLAVLHFLWLVKADYLEPTIYAIIAVVLLLHRVGPMKRLKLKSLAAR